MSNHRRRYSDFTVCALVVLLSVGNTGLSQTFCDSSTAAACFDFENGEVVEAVRFGVATIVDSLGDNAFLSINDNRNWQSGAFVFPTLEGTSNRLVVGGRTGAANSNHHLDDIEATANGDDLQFSAKVRTGGGTRLPADGFSINFVRPDDPVLEDGENWAEIAAHRFPEEGAQTGLAIGFDEWAATEPWDVPGISVRHNDVVVKQFSYPEFNGKLASNDSLQTGPNVTPIPEGPVPNDERIVPLNVPLDDLGWAGLTITRTGQQVTIEFKENTHRVTLPASNVDCTGDRVVQTDDIACSNQADLPDLLQLVEIVAGDFDLDGQVAFSDFLTLSQNFGDSTKAGVYANGDADLSQRIDFEDFLTLSKNFGRGTSEVAPVPEPAGWWMSCGLTLLAIHGKRRFSCSRD